MSTAASFTALHAPVAEDSMEMSSPANPTYDDDIDIDFDDNIGGVELTDDERMLEDNEQPRPATATDDMMEDDVPQQDMHVPEQEMQDGFDAAAYEQVDPDDELIDYGEDEYEDMAQTHDQTVYEPPAPEIPIEDREPEEPNLEQVDEEVVREPEAFVPEPESVPQPELVAVEETSSEPVPANQDADATETGAPNDTAVAVAEAAKNEGDVHAEIEANEGNAANDAGDAVTAVDEEHASHHVAPAPLEEPFPELPAESPEEQISAPVPAPLDTSLDAGADAPSTPTDTGLHPMVVQYGDWEWPLFKSSRQPEGLLKDDNLASVALADLLNNCRYRLAQKVGEDISNDQEFVLRFDSMGLAIVENSPSAFNTSLDEILEVYKQLHINDGAQTIPPFWLHLSLQPKFTSYLTMLKQAAAGGQGISSFVDVPADEVPENFGEYYPDGDDDPTLYGDASAAEYHDHQDHDDQHAVAEPQLAEGDYHEYDTSYANTEGGQEVQEGYHQYDETEQAEYEDYGEGDETNAPAENYDNADDDEAANAHARVEDPESVYNGDDAPQLEETDGLSHVDGEAHNTVLDGESEVQTTSAQEALGEAAGEAEGEGEGSHVESAASSTTLRADQANDSVEHGTDDNDESSTFLAEVDVEATDGSGADNGTHADSAANVAAHEATVLGESSILSDKDDHEAILEFVEVENDGSDQQNDETENAAASVHQSSGDEQHEPAQDESDLDSPQLEAQAAPAKEDHAHEAEESANGTVLDGATGNDEDYIDFGDDIDFDDDTYEQHEARKASEANNSGSKSPLGKRPLDQTGGVDLAEEPELKKVRSS